MNASATSTEDHHSRTVANSSPVVSIRGVTKTFGPTRAVDRVDLDLHPGEVHGLVGENGAGKSTLMRVLAGFHPDYGGQISIDGRAVAIAHPPQARTLGIALVHQELSLLPELTVAENIFLLTKDKNYDFIVANNDDMILGAVQVVRQFKLTGEDPHGRRGRLAGSARCHQERRARRHRVPGSRRPGRRGVWGCYLALSGVKLPKDILHPLQAGDQGQRG